LVNMSSSHVQISSYASWLVLHIPTQQRIHAQLPGALLITMVPVAKAAREQIHLGERPSGIRRRHALNHEQVQHIPTNSGIIILLAISFLL
jgi:hypothetical protein